MKAVFNKKFTSDSYEDCKNVLKKSFQSFQRFLKDKYSTEATEQVQDDDDDTKNWFEDIMVEHSVLKCPLYRLQATGDKWRTYFSNYCNR
ncbi:unnamed protein product [Rhizophagus irregularis]|nr:unnamed protein product [Rhizophagus irregularis]